MARQAIESDLGRAIGREVRGITPIETGHSGYTYWVDADGAARSVLRLPPPGARIAGPADVGRQGRIMAALAGAGLPVPRVLAMSDEPVVDGRPFVLVEKVDGERIEVVTGRVADETLARSAVEVLLRLHAVPIAATGIGGEAAMELGGELDRWVRLIERAPADLTGGAPALADELRRTLPGPVAPTLVHGDYHYGNLLFKHGRVTGVLDWEIAQLGQPLIDLGSLALVADASRRGFGVPGGTAVGVPLDLIIESYGADRGRMRWFLALAYFKLAAIFGYNLMLHRRGKRHDPHNELRAREVITYLDAGREVLAG